MQYLQPALDSSFKANNIGLTIYQYIREIRPNKVVEIGALNGYSTITIMQALHENMSPSALITIDLFELYPYKSCSLSDFKENICSTYSICKSVVTHTIKQYDALEYTNDLRADVNASDLIFLDISNDAQKIQIVSQLASCPILFEGGSEERDCVAWMKEYNKPPIRSLNKGEHPFYTILNHEFPSLSVTR